MRVKTTFLLVLAVAAGGLLLWFAAGDSRSNRDVEEAGGSLFTWHADAIDGLQIAAATLDAVLVKQDDLWFLKSPVRARADEGAVERMLSGLEALKRLEVVTPSQMDQRGLTLADYGLVAPAARWTLSDGAQRLELLVGQDAPLGNHVYVKFTDDPNVIATSGALRDLVPASVNLLRDAHILPGAPDRVSRLELHRDGFGFVRLARQDGRWLLRQPLEARADAGRVDALLDQLFALRASSYVWDSGAPVAAAETLGPVAVVTATVPGVPAADPTFNARVETYGLAEDEATARVQLWLDGDLVAYELRIGKLTEDGSGSRYAMRTDVQAIYTIQPTQAEWLVSSADDLRARAVFGVDPGGVRSLRIRRGESKIELGADDEGRWSLTDPVQWKADQQAVQDTVQALMRWQVVAFVSGGETNDALAALQRPYCILQLASSPTDSARAPAGSLGAAVDAAPSIASAPVPTLDARNWTGDADPLWIAMAVDGNSIYVRFESCPEIMRLPVAALAAIGEDPLNPLAYRERTMLAVPPDEIQRLSLEKEGHGQAVLRDGRGGWGAESGSNSVSSAAIADLLLLASNLRALRAEAQVPVLRSNFGFDPPVAVLTLGLKGELGIQKSILLGAPSRGDGVYAMVKGQDVVFAISTATAETLTRDLLLP